MVAASGGRKGLAHPGRIVAMNALLTKIANLSLLLMAALPIIALGFSHVA